ncbi:MAG: YkgJ family cysteine cluster protein [Methanoregula sp.]|nr:YkgJ family cysteine cluster protein [Methanoregula sp.]
MAFTCQQCGKCCSSMGEIIEILEELDPFFFRIKFTVTGEERVVSVDPDKRALFHLHDDKTLPPMACPFLRQTSNKKYVCAVHTSRPELCCRYSCYRILVLDSQERTVGRVTDATRYFITGDADLRRLWNREIACVKILDEKCWEEHVEQTLIRSGYRVIR